VSLLLRCVRNVFRKNADQPRFLTRCLVEQFGRLSFDKLAMRLKFSPQIPRRALPTISQVTKRGPADLALHNLLAIPHREFEHHQIGIIPNGLASRQRHGPGSFQWPVEADREVGPRAERLVKLPTVTDPTPSAQLARYQYFVDEGARSISPARAMRC